jgi:hypothetical protein
VHSVCAWLMLPHQERQMFAACMPCSHAQVLTVMFAALLLLWCRCSDETHLHWFHASTMELDTEFELIGILVGERHQGRDQRCTSRPLCALGAG